MPADEGGGVEPPRNGGWGGRSCIRSYEAGLLFAWEKEWEKAECRGRRRLWLRAAVRTEPRTDGPSQACGEQQDVRLLSVCACWEWGSDGAPGPVQEEEWLARGRCPPLCLESLPPMAGPWGGWKQAPCYPPCWAQPS